MCKRFIYLFLVFGFCLAAARGDLTMVPLSTWDITGDFGDILSLNGYPVSGLIVGTSEFADPPGQSGNEPAEAADDFSLETAACADGEAWMKTVFDQPVSIIFILEKNGNDSGTIQGLDESGNPVGNAKAFTGGSLYWTETGFLASLQSTQQIAYGAVLTSDIPIYGILITAPGIDPVSIMAVRGEAGLSSQPKPETGATDVPRDIVISWTPGKGAQTHDVYLGTVLEDVNNADRNNPLNVLVKRDQITNMYYPGILELGQTYFWRIDEVNALDSTLYKGKVWSFTVEPVAYKIPAGNIIATASGYEQDNEPDKTTNGSGLDVDDPYLHSTDTEAMWLSEAGDPGSAWIQYDFDKLYKLHQMLVWNYNGPSILTGYGLKDVTIEYSENGETWAVLPEANEFEQAPGEDGYQYNTIVNFNGMVAQSVRIIANSNWGGTIFDQYGLSEVRFLYIPVNAREPDPDSEATDIDVDVTLGWRAGREAVEHNVYLSTDEQAVIDGTASVVIVTDTSYSPSESLILENTYYWRVDEVNNAETPAIWQDGIWSFSTQKYLVVDDFESYNDLNPDDPESNRIFLKWIGGDDQPANGSQVGKDTFPFAEETIVNSGDQSMPLFYNNSGGATYSEAELSLESEDWTRAGIRTLVLYFHGTLGNAGQMYVKINGYKVPYPGDAADIARPIWQQWNIDLASLNVDLQNVTTLGIGIDNNGANGTLYVDDIRLYREAPAVPSETIWIEAEAADSITPPMQIFSAIPGASGGQYIEVESGNNSTSGPTNGVASYNITIGGGTYKINCRVIAPTTSNDSFYVNIPGATTQTVNHSSGWVRWNDIAGGSDWHWDIVHSSDDGNKEVEWTMAAGTYTLNIAYREEGALVDAIVITKIVLPPPPSEKLWIEAEDANPIGTLIQVVDDPAAPAASILQ